MLLQLVVLDDDRLDRQAGLELDLVDGVQIGRVGDAEEQALAALEQRQHAVLGQQLVGDGAHGLEVDVEGIEIEQRYAVFGRRRDGDVARLGGAGEHQLRDEAGLALAAACSAACMLASSTTPSCTRRWGRPPRVERVQLRASVIVH